MQLVSNKTFFLSEPINEFSIAPLSQNIQHVGSNLFSKTKAAANRETEQQLTSVNIDAFIWKLMSHNTHLASFETNVTSSEFIVCSTKPPLGFFPKRNPVTPKRTYSTNNEQRTPLFASKQTNQLQQVLEYPSAFSECN